MSGRWRVAARRVVAGVACVVASPCVADAHAIHTTLTVITATPTGGTLMVRVFADDFSAAVARHAGLPLPRDSSVTTSGVARYLASHLTLMVRGGAQVLQSCGTRRQAEVYWVCLQVPAAMTGAIQIRNTMLTELHADQINIVQIQRSDARQTALLTRANPTSQLTI
jgi:hypothetical protein